MSRYKNLSTERKRCWRSHKIQNETATTTDAGKKEFVCSSLEISLQCLNCSYLDVVYKKNILSIRWLHLTILIALFYFIYLNQLHHFLLYRNFHTLFFVLQLNESDHPSNQLLFFPLHPQRWIWACRCWCAWVFFSSAKAFRFRTQDIPFIFIFIWFISLWWINKGDDKEKRRQRKLRATDRSIALLIQRPTGMYVGVSNKGNVKKESKKKKEHNGGTFCEEWRWTKL